MAVSHNQQVPPLLRTVIARKREGSAGAYVKAGQPGIEKHVREEDLEGAHLGTTGNCATGARVNLARGNLSLLLPVPRVPERLYSLLEALINIC